MGDLNKRRGRVLGMDHVAGGKQMVTADVPMAEMYGYSTDLRAMSGGMGEFSYELQDTSRHLRMSRRRLLRQLKKKSSEQQSNIKSFERKRGLTSPLFLWYCKKVKKNAMTRNSKQGRASESCR